MKLTVKEHLAAPGGSKDVLAHASRLLQLDRHLKTLLPPALAGSCHVANLKAGTLVIHADSGVVAARLRQMTTRIAQQLSLSCLQCSQVEVKVQPSPGPRATPQAPHCTPLSPGAASCLHQAATAMPDGNPLRQALEHLLAQALIAPDTLPE
jgi:hypothetical protein